MNSVAALDSSVTVGADTTVLHSVVRHATIGRGCRLINSVIEGCAAAPVILGNDVTLINCHIRSTGKHSAFAFCGVEVDTWQTRLGDRVALSNARLVNTVLEQDCQGFGAAVEYSHIGPYNDLRNSSNITRSRTAAHCNLGSEVSKSLLLGDGFVSEHGNSYVSLLAPAAYPILTADGREDVLSGLPNVTNLGAGTVFANYGGEPIPAATVEDSPGSAKGTALVYTAFVCINCRVINRYGQPEGQPSPFDLLRRRDLTILGLGSFVEHKLTGRVPAFSYASDLSPRSHRLGWVLAKKPGILLNFVTKMREVLGTEAGRLQELIPGTLRLEQQLLQEELEGRRPTLYSHEQLQEGLHILQSHLQDGRWSMREDGTWRYRWGFDQAQQQWCCQTP